MKHGDIIQLLEEGPSIGLKSLEPIGISDGSQCWGVWIDHRYRKGIPKEEPGFATKARDFVISPIHPSLWPFAFRVEVALNWQRGTLKSLCKQLDQNGVNILHLNQSPGGYTHSVFNAICAFDYKSDSDLFKILEKLENDLRPCWQSFVDDNEEFQRRLSNLRFEAMRELGTQMVVHLAGLWACLRIVEQEQYDKRSKRGQKSADPKQDIYFLSSRVVEQGLEPWFIRLLDPGGVLLDLQEPDSNDPDALISFEEAKQRVAEANATMTDILSRKFPTDVVSLKDKTIDELLTRLKHYHKKTRYQPGDTGPLTVQAVMAHMDDEKWKRHILRRVMWRHAHLPLSVCALVRLAEMRFWMAPHKPIEFQYSADRKLLVPTNKDDFVSQMKTLGYCEELTRDKPAWALAIYNHEDRFLRLRMLPNRTRKLRMRIDVNYSVSGLVTPDPLFAGYRHQPARTKGLIGRIAGIIYTAGGNVMRVTNSLGRFDPNTGVEKGDIHFAVEFESGEITAKKKENLLKDIETEARMVVKPTELEECRISAEDFEREQIFVSTISEHGRFKDFQKILNQVAADYGLETVYAETYVKGANSNVHEKIYKCKYFLQIIAARKDDMQAISSNHNYIPDLTWVTYECGCAAALREVDHSRRCVQMIDELLPQAARDRLDRISADIAPIRFHIDDNEETMRNHFRKAIEELIK